MTDSQNLIHESASLLFHIKHFPAIKQKGQSRNKAINSRILNAETKLVAKITTEMVSEVGETSISSLCNLRKNLRIVELVIDSIILAPPKLKEAQNDNTQKDEDTKVVSFKLLKAHLGRLKLIGYGVSEEEKMK